MYLAPQNVLALILYCSKRSNSEYLFSDFSAGKKPRVVHVLVWLMLSNYWAWVVKLKSCLEFAMPFAVANYCLNTSPHCYAGVG